MRFASGKALGAMLGAALGIAAHSETLVLIFGALGLLVGHLVDSRDSRNASGDALSEGWASRDPLTLRDPDGVQDEAGSAPYPTAVPEPRSQEELQGEERARDAVPLTQLFIAVACADSDLNAEEVRAVRRYFEEARGYRPPEMDSVRRALKSALAAREPLEAAAAQARSLFDAPARVALLDALFATALADADLNRAERDTLKLLGALLYIPESDQLDVLHHHLGRALEHYAALGIPATSTDDEVKTAYRRLASEHHPDRVAAKGKKAVDAASERFRQVKTAYEEIRIRRGF